MKALLVVAAVASVCAVGAGAGVRATPSPCGGATPLRGAPILRLGPLRIAGFGSDRCAGIVLGCGPKQGGWQAPLSIELSKKLAAPIVLRSSTKAVTFALVGSTTPAPNVPRCEQATRARATATLRAPKLYYVLFVFAPKNTKFQLSATRGGRQIGAAVIRAAGP